MPEVVQYEKTIIEIPEIDYESLITEDNEPVDNVFSEKQQRLLVEPLYTSWKPESHLRIFQYTRRNGSVSVRMFA